MDREKVINEIGELLNGYPVFIPEAAKRGLSDALALLKEQETVNWIKCTDKLPNVDGCYLVVKSIMGRYSKIDVCEFTLNLHDTDAFDFPDEKRPGWYEHDPETGYFEWTGITHWATLPRLPEGINEVCIKKFRYVGI